MISQQAILTGIAALILATAAGTAHAQTGSGHGALQQPGTVVGKLYDRENGEPLVGGMIVIEGTSLGNVANDDGSFFVSDVPAGVYRVRAEYLGYAPATRSVTVAPGGRATVDFGLSSDVVQVQTIVARVEKEPIPVTPPVKAYTVSSEVQTHIPEAMPPETCRIETTIHGSYIINGTWQLSASVGGLVCGDQVIECRPVVVRKPELAAVTDDAAAAAGGSAAEAGLPGASAGTATSP